MIPGLIFAALSAPVIFGAIGLLAMRHVHETNSRHMDE